MKASSKSRRLASIATGFALAATGLLATAPAAHATTDLGSVAIVEGQGVGDLVTVGQSRSQLISTLDSLGANNGNCTYDDTCVFRLSSDTSAIRVTFDNADEVAGITVTQGGIAPDKRWDTTRGVVDGMAPADVAALYPGAEVVVDNTGTHVVADEYGYTYNFRSSCYATSCTITTSHEIYAAGDQPSEEVTEGVFSGQFSVYNSSRKAATLQFKLTVTAPNGAVTNKSYSVRVSGRSTYTVDPATVLSTDGERGNYSYTAELIRGKRTVASNSGVVTLADAS